MAAAWAWMRMQSSCMVTSPSDAREGFSAVGDQQTTAMVSALDYRLITQRSFAQPLSLISLFM
jgi:hypothetical protein